MALGRKQAFLLGMIASGLFYCAGLVAQSSTSAARIVEPIDESRLVTLSGQTHPLANAANDHGAAPDAMPLERMHLVLKRSASQEAALSQLIAAMHSPGSANYHQWLTAEDFGKRFGPSDQDIATVTNWLQSHGFSVTKVNAGRQTLEFGGNVGQLRSAFHTQIHNYQVNGESHYAAAGDPSIPAALQPVVGGFVSLNNFRLKSYAHLLGKAGYNPKTDKATPQWTIGNSSGFDFVLAPQDFAVQYDLNPLYNAGVDGSGQSIAIINESNINIALVNSFRSLFGLPYNPPQVIIDGNDPGVDGINNPWGGNGASVEAYLDVEWAGAVAPKAQVDLVIGADTALESGLNLALEHAVYSNVAPIISLSFGECEAALGSNNQFFSSLYEQAAAQGITVLVSTGDSGSAGCDSSGSEYASYGQAVSGLASTPYNIGVGGTDFYYSDYNASSSELSNQLFSYWGVNVSNNTPTVSILGVIPEQPWNDSQYGLNAYNEYASTNGLITTIAGGGGGASSSALCTVYGTGNTCTGTLSGYPKPAWQSGSGVPTDGVRDIPDVSLFAANGDNYSFYPICYYDGDCQPVSSSDSVQFTGVGGTSASTPAFAGIMALVNQKYGRQGQAAHVLYPLATQFPNSFHDVTVGTNSVPCDSTTTGCIPVSDPATIKNWSTGATVTEGQIGSGSTASYNAGPGYDQASGLGTIDAANLVTNWNKVVLAATKTTLTPSQTIFAHGTSIDISGAVTSSSGTPTGDVALMTDNLDTNQQGLTFFTLNKGTYSASISTLPGGSYSIWGQYGGDATNALSKSDPVQITVVPEASTTNLTAENLGTDNGPQYVSSGSSISYGSNFVLYALPTPGFSPTGHTTPTGTVTFTDNGQTIATVALNSTGVAELDAAWSLGSHSVIANYSGDQSYNPSSAAAFLFTIVKQTPYFGYAVQYPAGPPTTPGMGTAHLTIQAVQSLFHANANTAEPTGTVTLSSVPAGITGSATLIPSTLQSLANLDIQAAPGSYALAVNYSGDANFLATQQTVTIPQVPIVISTPGTLLASTMDVTLTGSISPTTSVTVTVTITGQTGHPAPSGMVWMVDPGFNLYGWGFGSGTGDVTTFSFVLDSQKLGAGNNYLTFAYGGDSVYNGSIFAVSQPIVNTLSDFTMVPDSNIVPIVTGSSATEDINLTSVFGFSGAVSLTCTAPAATTCTIPSSVTLTSGGTATAKVTLTPPSGAAGNYDVLIVGQDSTGKYVHTLNLKAVVGSANSGPQGFVLTNSGNLTVITGSTNGDTSTITLTSANGFSGTVNLSCAVTTTIASPHDLPTCSLASSSVDVGSSSAKTDILTIKTTAATARINPLPSLFWPSTGGTVLALLFLFRLPKRRRGWFAMLGVLVLLLSFAGLGCGGSSSNSGGGGGDSGTTPGAYSVTVTGASGSLSQQTIVYVNVQ
ncbi:MAG: protease pro-enzyme activation domain-containing protein [Terracidiphilus sp.]